MELCLFCIKPSKSYVYLIASEITQKDMGEMDPY